MAKNLREIRIKQENTNDKVFQGENGELYRVKLEPLSTPATGLVMLRVLVSEAAEQDHKVVRQLASADFTVAPPVDENSPSAGDQINSQISSMIAQAEATKASLDSSKDYLVNVWGIDFNRIPAEATPMPVQDNPNLQFINDREVDEETGLDQ